MKVKVLKTIEIGTRDHKIEDPRDPRFVDWNQHLPGAVVEISKDRAAGLIAKGFVEEVREKAASTAAGKPGGKDAGGAGGPGAGSGGE